MPGAGKYSYAQLEQLWISAGGSKALAPLMAAIALAESGGDPGANNYTDNSGAQTSWGLWQVSDGTHSWPGTADPNDPLNNAKYAVAKYKSQGLGAWGTYDSGAYKQYYQSGVAPSTLPQGGGGGTADLTSINPTWLEGPQGIIQGISQTIAGWLSGGKAPLSGLEAIAGDFTAALKGIEWLFVPSHWVRMSCFLLGLLLFIPGMRNLARAGSGDMGLAVGILQITVACMLWFFAFHNLPDDVKSIEDLLGYISTEIRGEPHLTAADKAATV